MSVQVRRGPQPLPLTLVLRQHGTLIRQGAIGDGLWLVESGALRVATISDAGHELVIDVLGPGHGAGEPAGVPSPVTVRALRPCRLCPVSGRAAADLLTTRAHRAAALAADLAWLDVRTRDRAAARGSLAAVRPSGRRRQAHPAAPHAGRGGGARRNHPGVGEPGAPRDGGRRRHPRRRARPLRRADAVPARSMMEADRPERLTACIARCLASVMSDDDAYGPSTYGDRIAGVYDEMYPVVPTAPDVASDGRLPGVARRRGAGARAGDRDRQGGDPARRGRRRRPRHRRVGGDGRAVASETGRRGDPGHDRRLPRLLARYDVHGDLRPVQHVLRAAHPGRSGDVLPNGRPTPHARRRLRDGGVRVRSHLLRPRSARIGHSRSTRTGSRSTSRSTTPSRSGATVNTW